MIDIIDDKTLVERCRAGDEQAAQILFNRFVERLLVLAQRRIGHRLAGRVDAEDVVQSVFRTFFCRLRADQFTFAEQDDLFKLLVRITVHKTLRQIAFHQAAKRDAMLETPHGSTTQERLLAVVDGEPTPEVIVAFTDYLENFLGKLSELDRRILELRLQGYTSEEIAQQLGTYDRKVRRVLDRIRAIASQEAANEDA